MLNVGSVKHGKERVNAKHAVQKLYVWRPVNTANKVSLQITNSSILNCLFYRYLYYISDTDLNEILREEMFAF